jgi:hypothetical protein
MHGLNPEKALGVLSAYLFFHSSRLTIMKGCESAESPMRRPRDPKKGGAELCGVAVLIRFPGCGAFFPSFSSSSAS